MSFVHDLLCKLGRAVCTYIKMQFECECDETFLINGNVSYYYNCMYVY